MFVEYLAKSLSYQIRYMRWGLADFPHASENNQRLYEALYPYLDGTSTALSRLDFRTSVKAQTE
jgi:hypothetical protein